MRLPLATQLVRRSAHTFRHYQCQSEVDNKGVGADSSLWPLSLSFPAQIQSAALARDESDCRALQFLVQCTAIRSILAGVAGQALQYAS